MKESKYGNRGRVFEEHLKYANALYQQEGIAVIEKIPTEFIPLRNAKGKIVSVKVEGKSTVDFIGRYEDIPVAIEAKNTNQGTIRFDAVQPHQADFLDAYTAHTGTLGLVLISFSLERFYAVPWTFWSAGYDLRVRQDDRTTEKQVQAFGEVWDIPKKKSMREADLLPEWQVDGNSPKFGIDYLKNVKKYTIVA